MQFGIDKASFYTPHYFLQLATLAEARNIDVNKFHAGLGQYEMAVPAPNEDIVTMGANAAEQLLNEQDKSDIDTLLFATESSIDQSKSAGIFVHQLLGLPKHCRVLELKQACYSATAGLQMAMALLQQNPTRKILLIASDIARYGLGSSGESSQGGGAVALLLSASPRLVAIEPGSGYCTEDVMDFWRPNYCDEAIVEGKYSCDVYLRLLKEAWQQYTESTQRQFNDHRAFCFHSPVPKLVEKAYKKLCLTNKQKTTVEAIQANTEDSLKYAKTTGNCYTASLYLCLLSFLENCQQNLEGQRIGFYSYGSGASAEFFSGVVQHNYQHVLLRDTHQRLLAIRHPLSIEEYENFYNFELPTDESTLILPHYQTGTFCLEKIADHKRIYQRCAVDKPIAASKAQDTLTV